MKGGVKGRGSGEGLRAGNVNEREGRNADRREYTKEGNNGQGRDNRRKGKERERERIVEW